MNRPTQLVRWTCALLMGGCAMFVAAPRATADDVDDAAVLLAQVDDDAMADEAVEPDRPRPDRERLEKLREWRERRDADGAEADRPRDARPPFGLPPDLTEEQQTQALSVLRDLNPEVARKMEAALQGENSRRAERGLARMSGRLLEMYEVKQRDSEAYRLRVADHRAKLETFKLARQLKQAQADGNAERIEQVQAKLRAHLGKHFEIRQRLREKELQMLEQRIERMREELKEHRARKQELIEQSLTRIREGKPDPEGEGDEPPRPPRPGPLPPDRDNQLELD